MTAERPSERLGTIATARLDLRPLTADDVDLLLDLDSDPEVMRFLTGGRPSTRAEVEELVGRAAGQRWVACAPEQDHPDRHGFAGWFALRPTAPDEYELGYRLRRRFWGQGLATEGAAALVDAAFRTLGAQSVWAETMTVNARSRAVLERCGLRYVRTFHLEWDEPIEGTEEGDVEYRLDREGWERLTTP